MTENEQRNEREKNIVRRLIAHLDSVGFDVIAIDDGGEWVPCEGAPFLTVIDTVFSVDESTVRVKHRVSGRKYSILLVLGNDADIVSDHSAPDPDRDGFNAAMDAFAAAEEARENPRPVSEVITLALDAVDGRGIKVGAVYALGDNLSADVVGEDGKKYQVEIKITEVPK